MNQNKGLYDNSSLFDKFIYYDMGSVREIIFKTPALIWKLRKNKYDLVVLDQYMPNMDGTEVAQCIRKLSDSIPMVAITSDDDGILKESFFDSGFNEVLIKPLHGDEVLEIILSLLSSSSSSIRSS